MENCFCTITTKSHLFKCFALANSLVKSNGVLNILIIDDKQIPDGAPSNVQFYFLDQLEGSLAVDIKKKYASSKDKLRWCLKPVFLNFLLKTNSKAIYVDNDIYFFNEAHFLFEELEQNNLLLTPHHYLRDPENKQNWLEANFRVGLYNAGFIAANLNAKSALEWWAKACLYRCEKNFWRGLFDDQKYLDLMPIVEPKTKVLTHLGCNVAEWNKEICKRSFKEGKHLINEEFLVVFYHFNPYSLKQLEKEDPIFQEYIKALQVYKKELSSFFLDKKLGFLDKCKLSLWTLLNKFNS